MWGLSGAAAGWIAMSAGRRMVAALLVKCEGPDRSRVSMVQIDEGLDWVMGPLGVWREGAGGENLPTVELGSCQCFSSLQYACEPRLRLGKLQLGL